MALSPLDAPRTLSLMPTFRCNASCKSCGTLSSPAADISLTVEQVRQAMRQAKDAGIELVVFTGGEATLEPELLFEGLRYAKDLGMLTRLVTNAHWANTYLEARSLLDDLVSIGLNEINYSTGDQHARFVPVHSVLTAVRCALECGLTPAVMIETTARRTVTKDLLEQDPYQVETRCRFPGRVIRFDESPWMPLTPGRIQKYPDDMAVTKVNLSRTRGCDSVLQTVTIQATGEIGACCGLGLRLIPELHMGHLGATTIKEALDEGEADLLKRWIKLEGPERIVAWSAAKDPSIDWEGKYAHRCQACLRLYKDDSIRKVIEKYYMEKMPDIIYGEYLLYHLKEPELAVDEAPGVESDQS